MTNEELSMQTKKQLAEALKEAMHHKSFSKISVKDIVEVCGINRKTFYYHFEDIYDLLRWTLDLEQKETILKLFDSGDFEDSLGQVMDHIEKNQYFVNCAYDAVGQMGLKQFFAAGFVNMSTGIIKQAEKKAGCKLDQEYRDFLIRFYAEGIACIIMDWITEKDFPDKKATLKYIMRIIQTAEQSVKMG